MHLRIKAIPGSSCFQIAIANPKSSNKITIRTKAKAENNKANAEIVAHLSELLGCAVRLVKGAKSANKVLELGCDAEIFMEKTGIKLTKW